MFEGEIFRRLYVHGQVHQTLSSIVLISSERGKNLDLNDVGPLKNSRNVYIHTVL